LKLWETERERRLMKRLEGKCLGQLPFEDHHGSQADGRDAKAGRCRWRDGERRWRRPQLGKEEMKLLKKITRKYT
jgi:hypothetical protein